MKLACGLGNGQRVGVKRQQLDREAELLGAITQQLRVGDDDPFAGRWVLRQHHA